MPEKFTEKDKEYEKEYVVATISKYDILYTLENNDNLEEIEQKVEAMSDKGMKDLASHMWDAHCNAFTKFLTEYFED